MTRKEEREQAARLYSPNNAHYTADTFEYGAEWADKTMLDKVCEWLKERMHFTEGIANGEIYYQCNSIESFLNDLKQAMEE